MCAHEPDGMTISPVVFSNTLNRMFRNRARLCTQACVEGWLSATGLVAGEVHVNAEAVENVHDGLTSLRVERIDETGDEELNVSHVSIVIRLKSRISNSRKFGMIARYEQLSKLKLPNSFDLPKRIARLANLPITCGGRGSPKPRASLANLIMICGNALDTTRSVCCVRSSVPRLNQAAKDKDYLALYDAVFARFRLRISSNGNMDESDSS